MAGLPINAGSLMEIIQMGAIGLGVYEGYLWYTGAVSAIPNDPIIAFLRTIQLPSSLPNPCPTGFHLVGNTCVADTPITCPVGQHLANGVCVPDIITCPTGYQLVNGICTPITITCPLGQHLANGVCVPDVLTCPAGQQLVNGVCVAIGTGDVTKPLISILSPTIGANLTNATITVSGSSSDTGGSGVAQVFVRARPSDSLATTGYIPATPAAPGNWSSWTCTINLTALGVSPINSYDIVARADDVAGNSGLQVMLVYYTPGIPVTCPAGQQLVNGVCVPITTTDVTPPTVLITSPVTGATAANNLINVSGVASDIGSGINAVFVRIANGIGTPWQQATPIAAGNWSQWQATVDLLSLGAAGPYMLEARADDKAGNQQWSVQVTVNYTPGVPVTCPAGQHLANGVCVPDVITDLTLPLLTVTSPVNLATVAGPIVAVSGTSSDVGGSGVKEVFMRARPVGSIITTGYVLATPIAPGNWSSWTVNVNLIAFGTSPTGDYEIIGLCRDNALNVRNSKTTLKCTNCVIVQPPTCTPPQILQNGVCVTPTTLTPTATPNKLIYATNEVMTITGAGFMPNEIVGCRYTSNGVLVLARDVNANAAGGFVVTFVASGGGHVTCTGRTSNAVGQTPAITVNATGSLVYARGMTTNVRTHIGYAYAMNTKRRQQEAVPLMRISI